jgi:hypothetical protein
MGKGMQGVSAATGGDLSAAASDVVAVDEQVPAIRAGV